MSSNLPTCHFFFSLFKRKEIDKINLKIIFLITLVPFSKKKKKNFSPIFFFFLVQDAKRRQTCMSSRAT